LYKNIFVMLDNSSYSLWGLDFSLELAKEYGSTLIGNHAYAARLHETRFTQMEPGLPERYQLPEELAKQREIHGTLIEKGLTIISDSFLDVFEKRCGEKGIPCVRKMSEGKNYEELVKDVQASNYDLVAMGARGLGEVPTSQLGSVCERVTRRINVDALIMKNDTPIKGGQVVVCVDGSGQSFAAMKMAIELNKRFGCKINALSVFDPDFHYHVFNNLTEVLSKEAGEVFNFEQQKALHEEIIDAGLEKIYKDHLDRAADMAKREGIEIEAEILPGKPYDAILNWMKDKTPALLMMGKVGVHSCDGLDIGSNSENLLRNADCNVMLFSRSFEPQIMESEENLQELEWTPEALSMLERVPSFVRRMVKGHIEANARKNDIRVITQEIMDEAKKKMMGG